MAGEAVQGKLAMVAIFPLKVAVALGVTVRGAVSAPILALDLGRPGIISAAA